MESTYSNPTMGRRDRHDRCASPNFHVEKNFCSNSSIRRAQDNRPIKASLLLTVSCSCQMCCRAGFYLTATSPIWYKWIHRFRRHSFSLDRPLWVFEKGGSVKAREVPVSRCASLSQARQKPDILTACGCAHCLRIVQQHIVLVPDFTCFGTWPKHNYRFYGYL